ncbi:hypothetical protein [Serinicoccus hydrothermalis]|uniref:hypothetical protein n=1 Tax=Serinicoccus hydrothermalis TaxID=1758689 RepID=UPI0012F7F6E2|nr:hypothetical protein [Serinicoccus hydrothermalis]
MATIERVQELCDAAREALLAGLRAATATHGRLGYSPTADMHHFYHSVRREAMEQLKQLNPDLEEQDNLGFAMSGLILTTSTDVVRVWHTVERLIPPPTSERARSFVTQRSAWSPGALFSSLAADEEAAGALPGTKRNHLILQWTESGTDLMRLRLVRPLRIGGRPACVEPDWSHDLHPAEARRADLTYSRRDDGDKREEGQA